MARSCVRTVATLFALAGAFSAGCGDGDGTTDASVPPADAPGLPDAGPLPPDARPPPDANDVDAVILPQGASCDDPIPLAPGAGDTNDTSQMLPQHGSTCSAGAGLANETKYLIDLGATPIDLVVDVMVDENATPPFDTVLHARTDCGAYATEFACVDAGWSERLEILDHMGPIYLSVDSTAQHGGQTAGAYTLSTATRAIIATGNACDPNGVIDRCQSGARCVAGSCVADSPAVACGAAVTLDLTGATATATATTWAYAADHYQGPCAFDPSAGAPEHIYRFTLAAAANVVATTDDPATRFDTVLYLRSATCDGAAIACDDDVDAPAGNFRSTLSAPALPAGTYYLFVDGSSAAAATGPYRLTVTVSPL
jgi:hypothetical protein